MKEHKSIGVKKFLFIKYKSLKLIIPIQIYFTKTKFLSKMKVSIILDEEQMARYGQIYRFVKVSIKYLSISVIASRWLFSH